MILGLVAFAACDDDNGNGAPPAGTPGGNGQTGELDYGSLGGQIRVDGSSTVFPVTQAMAEEFGRVSNTRVNVAFSGTGGGFERFCRGETQISNASRPISDSEREACAANDIDDIVEVQVAIDALTVVVNPGNDFVDCMTVEQLHDAFKEPRARQWSDIDPSWPSDEIELFFPGIDSGTFDYFLEAVVEGVEEEATHTGDGTPSEDDNVLVQGIANSRNGLGYFGFAYYLEAGSSLKAIAIDGGEGCVEPTFENALDGSYTPLSRPLFIYTRESFLRERPEVLGFVKFYVDSIEEIVPEVGYVSLPDALLAEQQAKVEAFLP